MLRVGISRWYLFLSSLAPVVPSLSIIVLLYKTFGTMVCLRFFEAHLQKYNSSYNILTCAPLYHLYSVFLLFHISINFVLIQIFLYLLILHLYAFSRKLTEIIRCYFSCCINHPLTPASFAPAFCKKTIIITIQTFLYSRFIG